MVKKNKNNNGTSILSNLKAKKVSGGQMLLIILSIAVLMLAYTWKQVEMNKTLRNIEDLKKAVVKNNQLNETARMEITKLESFKNIETYARENLNLVFPDKSVDLLIMEFPVVTVNDSLIAKFITGDLP